VTDSILVFVDAFVLGTAVINNNNTVVGEIAPGPPLYLEHLGFGHLPFHEKNPTFQLSS